MNTAFNSRWTLTLCNPQTQKFTYQETILRKHYCKVVQWNRFLNLFNSKRGKRNEYSRSPLKKRCATYRNFYKRKTRNTDKETGKLTENQDPCWLVNRQGERLSPISTFFSFVSSRAITDAPHSRFRRRDPNKCFLNFLKMLLLVLNQIYTRVFHLWKTIDLDSVWFGDSHSYQLSFLL